MQVDEGWPGPAESNTSNDSVVQMLADRCHTLEQANKHLQDEARSQQRQYEVCLDRVATQVVQALLSQKVCSLTEIECEGVEFLLSTFSVIFLGGCKGNKQLITNVLKYF